MSRTVVFTLGLGHSGSTLLGYVLGSHPQILYLGEVMPPIVLGEPIKCLFCDDRPCPIWGETLGEPFLHSYYGSLYSSFSGPFLRTRVKRLLGLSEPSGSLYHRLFQACSGIDVILDSSKDVQWADWNARSSMYQTKYILLLRDLRGPVASRLRRESESITEATKLLADRLQDQLRFYREQEPDRRISVYYEQMVTEPALVFGDLCEFLEIPYVPEMLDYHSSEHHVIYGNIAPTLQIRMAKGKSPSDSSDDMDQAAEGFHDRLGFKLDERWKQELNQEMLEEFDSVAGRLNRELGYAV
jgi:hypothetical protein